MASSLISSIRDLLAADKLDDALNPCASCSTTAPCSMKAILQSARWNDIGRKYAKALSARKMRM
ncbi:MAG: hypothetical protein IPJ40_08685 [Saprospirales bacterium]|nr:hypothetical protein [Saprospirales bacterium]